ncbi:hypothetical protein C0Q70_07460 [Pomacea canaliculata]|uniref:EF-hand domain-containing protein n=1 Tax=Pomacea canaliculata TaxID=400727 RepID=A0A2T7PF60_POMCA|nr:hypothetical protein C0Q70_07460 [Pomacea canaliculata]
MYIYGHSLYAVPPVAPGAVPFLPLWQQYQAGFQPSRNQSPADDKRAQMLQVVLLSAILGVEIREAFDVLDNDKDGRLNAAELETLLRGQFVVASNKELKELLENMDADKDGSVDYEEFEAFVAKNGLYKASVEEVSQELKDAFQVFDRDGDGYIDVDEFKSVMMNIGDKMSEEEVKKMMEEADSDKDGKIDYNAVIGMLLVEILLKSLAGLQGTKGGGVPFHRHHTTFHGRC